MKEVRFLLGGIVPPNWSNRRLSPMEAYAQKTNLANLTSMLALQAMMHARVPKAEEGEVRIVTITQYRVAELDRDGLYASVKPIIDGLTRFARKKMGVRMVKIDRCGLIYDDDPRHLPAEALRLHQFRVGTRKEQDTAVIVRVP